MKTIRRAIPTIGRALMRRCPHCGGRGVFKSYLKSRERCPACGLLLERGERDYFIGAYTINLIVAEMMVFFGGLAVLVATWPDVPWTGLMYGLAALMVAGPIILYPFSRQLWLALDLVFRPAEPADFEPTYASPDPSGPPYADGLKRTSHMKLGRDA